MGVVETLFPPEGQSPNQKSRTPYRDKPRTGAGSSLALFLFLEEPFQVDAADGGGSGIKALAHLDFLAHLLSQVSGDVEGLRFSADQHGNLELGMKAFSVSAMAVGTTTGAFAFDKRAGQHFAERAEAADEFAAQFQVGFAGRFHMTLIIVSEIREVKSPQRFARMPSN